MFKIILTIVLTIIVMTPNISNATLKTRSSNDLILPYKQTQLRTYSGVRDSIRQQRNEYIIAICKSQGYNLKIYSYGVMFNASNRAYFELMNGKKFTLLDNESPCLIFRDMSLKSVEEFAKPFISRNIVGVYYTIGKPIE